MFIYCHFKVGVDQKEIIIKREREREGEKGNF